MEPVPETERMEAFRSSPLPSLRLNNPHIPSVLELDTSKKPASTMRRGVDSNPSSPISPIWGPLSAAIPHRSRTASPLSGAHSRSRSVASLAPAMSRTQSMPGLNGSGHILYSPQFRPASPMGSPSRVRTPRKPADEAFPAASPVRTTVLNHDRQPIDRSISPVLGSPAISATRLRRTSSPLRNFGQTTATSFSSFSGGTPLSTSSSSSSSSTYRAYDPFSSSFSGGAYSSVPSTPTSTRSRSPSISSLETIPDSPDAEEAALEAERLAHLKAAAESADSADANDASDVKGRSSLDGPIRGRTMSYGSRDKRKRWSVCGAERRGDLDLETIWED